MTKIIIGLFLITMASYSLTALVHFYALKKNILDIPNERSSHSIVTPRGGGLAIAATFIFLLAFFTVLGIVPVNVATALMGGGLMVAAIGWMDDQKSVSPRLRLIAHFLAAVWALYWLDGFPRMDMGFTKVYLGWAGSVLAAVSIVWLINLYNFMDGIDGIAGVEAITVSAIAGAFLWYQASGQATVCLLLLASVLGFLIWNWPPAKIFMGDVGSGFLGFVFAVTALWSENSEAMPLLVWLLLLGVFIVDATVTLVKRMSRGEKLYEAHRSHVYQLAVQAGYSHKQVTLIVALINIILALIGAIALRYYDSMLMIVLAALCTLIMAHLVLGRMFNARISPGDATHEEEGLLKQSVTEAAAAKDTTFD